MNTYLNFALIIILALGLNIFAHKFLNQRWNLWLVYGICGLVMVLFMWNNTIGYGQDFTKAYYPAGSLIIQNPFRMYYTYQGEACRGFVNIPILAFLFTPFSLINKSTSLLIFTILGWAIFIANLLFLIRIAQLAELQIKILAGLFIINGPFYYSLKVGNTTHFVLFIFILALYLIQRKRDIWGGVFLAIAALIKVPLLLLGVYFIIRGRRRVIIGFGTSIIAVVGASLLFFGFNLHLAWYRECIAPFANKPIGAFNVQSVNGFLARLLLKSELNSWQLIEVGWDFKVVRYLILCLLIGGTTLICWRCKTPTTIEVENLEFSIVLCLTILTSPISWTHYYLLLLLPLSLYLGNKLAVPKGRVWFILIGVSALLMSPPVIRFKDEVFFQTFLLPRLLISHYFLGGIILIGVLLAARWHASKNFASLNLEGQIKN